MKMGLELVELTKGFHDLSNSAGLYARADTYDAIQATLAAMDSIGPGFRRNADEPATFTPQRVQTLEASRALLSFLRTYLARDIRDHLGLEQLPSHRSLPKAKE